jgi:hypothetical protein
MIPYLRTEVLFCLAVNGKLSKSMVERILQRHKHYSKTNNNKKQHHRPEILQAFKYLESKKLIKELNTNPGPGLTYGRGRPKTYFSITEEGLKTLLAATYVPAGRFWEIMNKYCLKNSTLTADKVEECYQIVMRRYLKYPNRGFSSELNNFYKCNDWLQAVTKYGKMTTQQRMIEVTAIHPRITSKKFMESIDDWSLDDIDFAPYGVGQLGRDRNGEETNELTLGGIMLCLILIYNNHVGNLKCGLYNKQFSFQEYCDKIASNYRTKLPLIFGKWDLLTEVLKELAIYNFVMILHKGDISSSNTNLNSVMLGGNEELCDGIRTISSYNAKLMEDFLNRGREFFENVLTKMSLGASDWEKIDPVTDKFREASALLNPVNWDRSTMFAQELFEKTERSFAEEITALYYMNLNSNIPLSTVIPKNHPLHSEHPEMLNHTPREHLSLIFQHDKGKPSLKEWYSSWMNDLTSLQQEIFENTKKMRFT